MEMREVFLKAIENLEKELDVPVKISVNESFINSGSEDEKFELSVHLGINKKVYEIVAISSDGEPEDAWNQVVMRTMFNGIIRML